MNEEKRGLKNIKNLIKWEGFKKEWIWIVFIIFILYNGWSYQRDLKLCKESQARQYDDWLKLTNGTGEIRTTTYNPIPLINFSVMNITTNMNTSNGT